MDSKSPASEKLADNQLRRYEELCRKQDRDNTRRLRPDKKKEKHDEEG